MSKALTYGMLDEYEKTKYVELVNRCDPDWLLKTVNKLPRKVAIAVITGGVSFGFTFIKTAYRGGKHIIFTSQARSFLNEKKVKYGCSSIDWDKFPNSYIVTGGSRYRIAAKEGMRCPACKKGKLQIFESTSTLKTLVCSQCSKTIFVKTTFGKIKEVSEVVVPGVLMIGAAIPILEFFGIEDMHDLIDHLDNLSDIFS